MVITGGTGSLGKILTRRLLRGDLGLPKRVVVFSRDEAKQYEMRLHYKQREVATEEIIYRNARDRLEFVIGDVRDRRSVTEVLRNADVVINAAALKQVPTCEYFPSEAVRTNIGGAESIIGATLEHGSHVETVVGVSTDKAAKPVNVMGMTKAIQERLFIGANLNSARTRFICVRYGNVLASRGSVIPLFLDQVRRGGPVTVTTVGMTRFLLSLNCAVDTVFTAIRDALPGETYVPKVGSARMIDVAKALIGDRRIAIEITGIRPGEKEHEVLVSEEERVRTIDRGRYFAIQPILPELRRTTEIHEGLRAEYRSDGDLLTINEIRSLLHEEHLTAEEALPERERSPD